MMWSHRKPVFDWVLFGCMAIAFCGCNKAQPSATHTAQPNQAEQIDVIEGKANAVQATNQIHDRISASPLPERDKTDGQTLFSKLAPEQTHLDFAHQWQPPEDYELELYQSLPGGGVCTGDFDGDDLPDVFLTQPNIGSRLYRNLGNMKFEDVTIKAGLGENPHAMGCCFVDVDGDADLDLYVCNFGYPNKLYVNQNDGTFQEQAFQSGLAYKGASVMAAFADYDRDGDLDAYLVTNRLNPTEPIDKYVRNVNDKLYVPKEDRQNADVVTSKDGKTHAFRSGEYDHFYRNNGDGSFTEVTSESGMQGNHWGLNAIWWDYNNDGWPDVYVSNDFFGPDQLYRNNGDGTFSDVAGDVLPHTPWYSMGTGVADINNDGLLDFMGSDMSGTNHYKQKVSMGDMNSTGWFLTHPTPRQYMRNALYVNTGLERFTEIAYLAGVANTDWTWALKFADFDEDGFVDLYVTNGMNRDWTNTDLRAQANAKPTPRESMQVWLDAEQRNDLNLGFKNTGKLKMLPMGNDWGIEAAKVSYGAALADFDQDGDVDLIVNNAEEAPSLYRNDSTATHRVASRLQGEQNRFAIGSRVTVQTPDGMQQTRFLTTSQGYMSSDEPVLHFGLGKNESIAKLSITWPDGTSEAFENIAADQSLTISKAATASSVSPEATQQATLLVSSNELRRVKHRETAFNDYERQPLLPMQHSQLGPGIARSDIDGDGDDDFFAGGGAGHPGQLHRNDGKGKFAKVDGPWGDDAAHEDMGVAFLDVDQDGDNDLYVASGGVECDPDSDLLADRIYINAGDGKFTRGELNLSSRSSGSCVCPCDFDQDGDVDLFVGGRVIPGRYPLTPDSQLLRNDNGQLVDATDELAKGLKQTGLVTSAIWSDANNDGWLDLLVATEWGSIKFFRNDNGTLHDQTATVGLSVRKGWYNSIVARDLDGDQDIDYVVGNVGLNTKYHATDEHPTQLYCGDFDASGNLRIIEAEFENEKLFPVRGKSCSTNAMPFLAQKFTKFHDFAVADLNTIYTEEKLSCAHHFTANSLESTVLLNDGNGNFTFKDLPREVQIAPVFGMTLTELNGDRFPDLVVAQNFYGPQRETGRFDGGVGLVLFGNGDGTYAPQPTVKSGLMLAGDAKSLATTDLECDGTLEFVFGMNSAATRVFRQPASTDTIAVRFDQPTPGAHVSVQHKDKSTQTSELNGGGSYLSQSAPCLQFGERASVSSITIRWPDGTQSGYQFEEAPPAQVTVSRQK